MTSSADTNGNGAGMSPLARFVVQVGVPAAIAIYLVWVTAGRQDARLEAMGTAMGAHVIESQKQGETLKEIRDLMRIQVDIDRQDCVNGANGDRQKTDACFVPGRGGQ